MLSYRPIDSKLRQLCKAFAWFIPKLDVSSSDVEQIFHDSGAQTLTTHTHIDMEVDT